MNELEAYEIADHHARQQVAGTLAAALLPLVTDFKDVSIEQSIKITADLYRSLLKEIWRK